jgi:hypothetical protein
MPILSYRIEEIIPSNDYQHRNGFNNTPLIDKLSDIERGQLEKALIHKLLFESEKEVDNLIVETFVHAILLLQNLSAVKESEI